MEPIFTGTTPPRYTEKPIPPYRHLPSLTPHPIRDPRGHSYRRLNEEITDFTADDWQNCSSYLYGIDLFNHGYWWEAHEALEQAWLAAGRETVTGQFIQGLIQIAAAQLKRYMGKERGAQALTENGIAKLSLMQGVYLGVKIEPLIATAQRCQQEDRNEYPRIELIFDVMAEKNDPIDNRPVTDGEYAP